MTKHPTGTVTWARDPTKMHDERPVIVLSHEKRSYNSTECTVVCLGTDSSTHAHATPEIKGRHLNGIQFGSTTYLLPWSLYTIPPSSLLPGKPIGQLTEEGEKLVGEALHKLARDAF